MGLSHSERYEPTSHFKDKLAERFNIHGAAWKLYMRQLYPKLEYDKRLSTRNTQKADVYHSRKNGIYLVVDPKGYKLITIFKDINELEHELGMMLDEVKSGNNNLEIETKPKNQDMNELINFAHQLLKEEDDLRMRNKFRYSQKVLQLNQNIINEFVSNYNDVLNGETKDEFIHKMNRLKNLEKKIHKIFENIELTTK